MLSCPRDFRPLSGRRRPLLAKKVLQIGQSGVFGVCNELCPGCGRGASVEIAARVVSLGTVTDAPRLWRLLTGRSV